jgi:hypothetical protein
MTGGKTADEWGKGSRRLGERQQTTGEKTVRDWRKDNT